MLTNIVIFFLALSIVFYVLFAGADFGAGVLEYITGRRHRQVVADAIGPVWEANHVWLVLVVVILFMGFPSIYSAMSLYLHIPLLLMLVGIIFRGTAFTFMHYDAIKDQSSRVYDAVFKISSIITPLFLRMFVGAAMLGRINPEAESFSEAFISPWLNLFSLSVGLFCLVLFTFLAAVYMIGETDEEPERKAFIRAGKQLNMAAVVVGGGVFIAAEWNGLPLLALFGESPVSLGSLVVTTLLLPVLWISLQHSWVLWSRLLAGAQVVLILFAWFWVQHPVVINMGASDPPLTVYSAAAPPATMLQLVIALIVGAAIILPFLYYLMKTFKAGQFKQG